MKARLLLLLLALPVLAFSQYKPWYNFYNFAFGAKARAMGNAFTAVADDLTASFWNPAGLAGKRGPEFYLGYMTSTQAHDFAPRPWSTGLKMQYGIGEYHTRRTPSCRATSTRSGIRAATSA